MSTTSLLSFAATLSCCCLVLTGCIKGSPNGSGQINYLSQNQQSIPNPAGQHTFGKAVDQQNILPAVDGNYGRFLTAMHARSIADYHKAATESFTLWQNDLPNLKVAINALVDSMLAGRFDRVRQIETYFSENLPSENSVLALLPDQRNALYMHRVVRSLQQQKYTEALTLLENEVQNLGVARYVRPIVQSWIMAGNQQHAAAVKLLDNDNQDQKIPNIWLLNQVYLLMYQTDTAAASLKLKKLLDSLNNPPQRLQALYAQLLFVTYGTASAQSYIRTLPSSLERVELEKTLREGGNFDASGIVIATAAKGLAEGLNELSKLLAIEIPHEGLYYAQLSRMLDADNQHAVIIAADVLIDIERYADAARLLQGIQDPKSIYYRDAAIMRSTAEQGRGNSEMAIDIMQHAIGLFPDDSNLMYELGQILQIEEDFEESAKAFGRAIAVRHRMQPQEPMWSHYYFRGIAYEQSDRWSLAEADFQKALKIDPGNPYASNYLAYTWIEQKQNIDRALGMLETAVQQEPNNAYIVDSYGWVLYRLRHFEEAAKHLEKAVMLEPSEAVINDHLGDVYWHLGRKVEARYQWQHALWLVIDDDEERSLIEDKLHGRTTPEI